MTSSPLPPPLLFRLPLPLVLVPPRLPLFLFPLPLLLPDQVVTSTDGSQISRRACWPSEPLGFSFSHASPPLPSCSSCSVKKADAAQEAHVLAPVSLVPTRDFQRRPALIESLPPLLLPRTSPPCLSVTMQIVVVEVLKAHVLACLSLMPTTEL